jgi:acetoin utilization deacetylase AcuC-like enzyme
MKNLAIIYSEKHKMHSPPFNHPERPERVSAIYNFLSESDFIKSADIISPEEINKEDILRIHTKEHYDFVIKSINEGKTLLDGGDTYIVKDSLQPALLSAGSALLAVDLVLKENYKSAFCLMRPPGHHAESNKPMGFCIFNNAAAGVQYALDKYNLERIALIDWDVHHGNGTQEIFYSSSEVFYISLHQYPFYPGTGASNEKGKGAGEGFTLNFPLSAGTDGHTYFRIFKEEIIKTLEKYDPQLIFLSAGFDAHKDDPLAEMRLTEEDFSDMTKLVKDFAGKKDIKIISVLEGGYNLNSLAASVYEHLKVLNS